MMTDFGWMAQAIPIVIIVNAVFVTVTAGFIFFFIFRQFGRVSKHVDAVLDAADEAAHAEKKRKALDIVANQPPGAPAFKCRNCGATVDSTAELSSDGRVRCNYCNQWSSIYQ